VTTTTGADKAEEFKTSVIHAKTTEDQGVTTRKELTEWMQLKDYAG
jgi:hypothetical protein